MRDAPKDDGYNGLGVTIPALGLGVVQDEAIRKTQ